MKKLLWMLAVLLMLPVMSRADSSISRVDGKQFPLVMFAVPGTDAHFKKVHDMGFDYVHIYGLTHGPVTDVVFKRIQTYLDLAQKHHLKVMLDLDGSRRVPTGDDGIADMRKVVQRFKNHPALGFWYLYDEPELRKVSTPAVLLKYYQMIKEETPDIPVCICTSTSSGKPGVDHKWYDFGDDYDILAFDTYPIRGQQFPTAHLETVTNFNKKAIALGEPVMPALQIFNFKALPSYVKKAEDAGQSTADWRYPNLQELRYWNFASLLQGARGMMYWSYMRAATVENTDATWLDKTLKPATLEFREFTNLVQPASEKEVLNIGAEKDIFFARWEKEGKQYLVLVNGESTARNITDAAVLQSLNAGKLKAWKFTRADMLHIESGKVNQVELQPWEVAVWEIS